MADRPILFSGPMVQALLAGRKTQTRRVHFTQSPAFVQTCNNGCDQRLTTMCILPAATCGRRSVTKARFAVGDRLWVREAWHAARSLNTTRPRDIPAEADIEHACTARGYAEIGLKGKIRPGMFMPRWASRLTLVVTDVRIERLQVITAGDAVAEGIESDPDTDAFWGADGQGIGGATRRYAHPEHAYRDLWDHLNEARGFGWEANPWVVAVTFTVHRANIDTLSRRIAA